MGRPSYAIASTSRITRQNIIDYVLAMGKAKRLSDIYVLNPGAIRAWLDKRQPYNAKIVKGRDGKTTIAYGDIFSTPQEFRAGEVITAASEEVIYQSMIALGIKRLKAFRCKSITVSEPETIEYTFENGDVAILNCPNGRITLDADKSEDSALIAQKEREKYLALVADLSEKDCQVKYNEVVRSVNTKGAQVTSLLKALSDGKIDSAAFAKACAKVDNQANADKPKSNKSKGTLSVIGTWGR